MSNLVANVSDAQMALLGRRVMNRALQIGFLSLSKRDLDLLLYFEMEQAGIVDGHADNHSVARELRITPSRLRSLRRDAYARWADAGQICDHLRSTLRRQFKRSAWTVVIRENEDLIRKDQHIPVLLEHPTDRAEIEQMVKQLHSIPRYARNREVLLIHTETLLAVVEQILGGPPAQDALAAAQTVLRKEASLKEFLTKDVTKLSWGEARAVLNKTVSEALTNVATGKLAGLLSGVFGALLG